MKVKHLSYEELVKLGAKCLAQPKAEVQIFCVKNMKISNKVPPQYRAFDNLGGLKMETHNVYLEPSTTEVTLYEKNIRRNIYEVCIQRAEEETQEEFFSRVLAILVSWDRKDLIEQMINPGVSPRIFYEVNNAKRYYFLYNSRLRDKDFSIKKILLYFNDIVELLWIWVSTRVISLMFSSLCSIWFDNTWAETNFPHVELCCFC